MLGDEGRRGKWANSQYMKSTGNRNGAELDQFWEAGLAYCLVAFRGSEGPLGQAAGGMDRAALAQG
jgi:hypothetical protein